MMLEAVVLAVAGAGVLMLVPDILCVFFAILNDEE